MEPGTGRLPLQVLGENEALQQFFEGQDVSGVLDSSVAVDTSILEQYLSNDVDPSSFMLPESPPDSCSEACSPAQMPDFPCEPTHWSTQQAAQVFQPTPPSSCHFKEQDPAPAHYQAPPHNLGHPDSSIKAGTSPGPGQYLSPDGHSQLYSPETPPPPRLYHSHGSATPCAGPGPGPVQHLTTPHSSCLLGVTSTLQSCSPENKKRRRSQSDELSARNQAPCSEVEAGPGSGLGLGTYQMLTWSQYRPELWSSLYSSTYQTLSPLVFHVDTDKGFVYSAADEAFICQKKNHFQVTVHIGVATEPQYVRTPSGPRAVDHFQVQVFGIKLDSPSHRVTIEQSQPDRSKKPFLPVRVDLPGGKIATVTLGRLHFSETTANNMRKKGRPNPDQRYFQMVVGLYAAVAAETFLLTALVSEPIIVRASNPGQFETDGDTLWQRGLVQDSVVVQGRVGINADSPDEALVVHGNAKVMGAVMQPSDSRAKENIQDVDSEQQLKRITQMRIVEFDYKPEFASTMGIDQTHQTGVIAQEVKELLPTAVKEVGDVSCSDGEMIENFLMVDKEQIFMENVGAVQQLSKLTDNLETRIEELEVWNRRLAKLKSLTGSLRSSGKLSTASTPSACDGSKTSKEKKKPGRCLRRRAYKIGVFTLLATMACCIITITTLYLLKLKVDHMENLTGHSNSSLVPTRPSDCTSTGSPYPWPDHWPPDVHFCKLLYCGQVYCCSPPADGVSEPNATFRDLVATETSNVTEVGLENLYLHLESSGDWKNTTIQSFMILESEQVIDSRYCMVDECGPSRYVFRVPISQFTPLNMRVTLVMNATELLVVHLCHFYESAECSALMDVSSLSSSRYPSNTQGEHFWPLPVAHLHYSSYHFRSAVAGIGDCDTDHHYAGALFTDYYFHFYRHCSDDSL
ncbi:uncharacterized protein V6R79_019454 [Siganus canaliculatus]